METIVKYKNRKLYSTVNSKYVNLNYIINQIKNNNDVIILEHGSNINVTNEVLSEAILKINVTTNDLINLIRKES